MSSFHGEKSPEVDLASSRRTFLTTSALLAGSLLLDAPFPAGLRASDHPPAMKRNVNLSIPDTLAELVHPNRAALLVYDMQVGIVPFVQESERVTRAVASLIAGAHQTGVPVFYSRHYQLPLRTVGPSQMRSAMRFQHAHRVADVKPQLQLGSPETQLVPAVRPGPDDVVFDKLGMSFFVGTPLEFCLRDLGVGTVIVAGCVAEIGIEPTVVQAEDLGFFTVTVSDACGSLDPAVHAAVMDRLGKTGRVATSQAVLDVWNR